MIEKVKSMLEESKRVVCIMGPEAMIECGAVDLWAPDNLFRIEKTYGKSPEEMLSAGEITTRKVYFYDFYKKEVIKNLPQPGPAYTAIRNLQDAGKISEVISFNIYGLEYRAGIHNVVELAGSVYVNYCPVCKKLYPVDYLQQSKSVPLCEECKASIRPNIRLHSEKVQNNLYTQASLACRNADMVLVLGMTLSGSKIRYVTGHYEGDRLVVVHKEPHYADKYADYVIYMPVKDVMSYLAEDY